MMLSLLFFAVLFSVCLAAPSSGSTDLYSFSNTVGGGSGTSFSTQGQGRITGVRVWEIPGSYVTGLQLRYDSMWSELVGRVNGPPNELELHDGEVIVQLSGKYHSNYVYQIIFVTSKGRFLMAGHPVQASFNMYPVNPKAELAMLSGRHNNNGITSVGAHWAVMVTPQTNDVEKI